MQELKRRGIEKVGPRRGGAPPGSEAPRAAPLPTAAPDRRPPHPARSQGQGSKPGLEVADKRPPQARNPFDVQSDELGGQLARSRALQSEGLEGLIPRASQLVALGGSFFLAFGPFIVAVLAVTGGVYLYWGDTFIHGGRPGAGMPSYIDPQDLLDEPTYDPMVPLRAPPPPVAAPAPGPVPIGENPNAAFY